MKFNEIHAFKKYYKLSAALTRRRGQKAEKAVNTIYVLTLDQVNKRVFASINQMPPQWYEQAVFAKWVKVTPPVCNQDKV